MKRWIKWVALFVALATGILFSIEATPIGDRAIVVGIAIDKIGDLYELSTQILVPTGNESAGNGSSINSVKAATISGAFNEMRKATSTQAALSHCNIIILGEEVIKNDTYNILEYMERNAYLSENVLLATAKSGREILETKVAHAEISSFYLQRIIFKYGNFNDIAKRNLKEFMVGYNSHNGANWITKIEKVSTQKPDIEGAAAAKEEEYFVFKLTNTALIIKNKFALEIDATMTAGLNYIKSQVNKGSINILGDRNEKIELYIIDKKESAKFNIDTLSAHFKVGFTMVIKEIIPQNGDEYNLQKNELSASEEGRLKEKIIGDIKSVYAAAQNSGVDIYDIYGGMYKSNAKKWKAKYGEIGEDYLKQAKIAVECKIKYE